MLIYLIVHRDTDWIFIKQDKLEAAGEALGKDGWVVL